MEENTFTKDEWNEIFRNLGRLVKEYVTSTLARIDDHTTELHDSKLTVLDNRTWKIQIRVNKMNKKNQKIVPQSVFALEILASFLDSVSTLREIDREITQAQNYDVDVRLERMADACISLVQMLSDATITEL
jgi:hypothetical protein